MLCTGPYRQGVQEFGCGQCMPCRINRRRLWVSRMMLEAYGHGDSVFATFTYDDEHLPLGGELRKDDLRLFFKRARHSVGKFRYFAVGEYGSRGARPHYHAALFGVSTLQQAALEAAWGQGFVHLGELNERSAGYLAGYIAKGMTRAEDERLEGKQPEFAVMSRRPGLGAGAVAGIAAAEWTRGGAAAVAVEGDVATVVRIGGRKWPLGRTLRRHLRGAVGLDDGAGKDRAAVVARQLAAHLRQPGAVEHRELVRQKDAQKAVAREAINRSRKVKL